MTGHQTHGPSFQQQVHRVVNTKKGENMSNNTATQTVKTIEPHDDPRLLLWNVKEFFESIELPALPELGKTDTDRSPESTG